MIGEEYIEGILKRLAELEATMAEGGAADDFVRLSKDYAELAPVAKTAQAVRDLRTEIADLGGGRGPREQARGDQAQREREDLSRRARHASNHGAGFRQRMSADRAGWPGLAGQYRRGRHALTTEGGARRGGLPTAPPRRPQVSIDQSSRLEQTRRPSVGYVCWSGDQPTTGRIA